MTDIVIISPPEDRERAAVIAAALRGAGVDLWWDQEKPGDVAGRSEQLDGARLALVIWSKAAIDSARNGDLLDQADRAKGRGIYLGVPIDAVEMPFGFGGLQSVDLARWSGKAGDPQLDALVEAVRARLSGGSTGFIPLPPPPEESAKPKKTGLLIGLVAAALIAVGIGIFLFSGAGGPSSKELIETQFASVPCAWLGIDPIEDGTNGTLGLTGVAGDPEQARATIASFVSTNNLPIKTVSIDKVAQIDSRECAAIDAPKRLRKDLGGRLRVTGEPFILNTSVTPNQALVRVQVALRDKDSSMALFGVEPSGKVTWSIPDIGLMRQLKDFDVGLVESGEKGWEFSIYPDHLGWTGLLLVVGDGPLAQKLDPNTVQSADDFAKTLRAATATGQWDAEMVWFRIDPDPAK
jgi:hypothetical protein